VVQLAGSEVGLLLESLDRLLCAWVSGQISVELRAAGAVLAWDLNGADTVLGSV
jgi:hypothetical protein